jgi:hypothetical protein
MPWPPRAKDVDVGAKVWVLALPVYSAVVWVRVSTPTERNGLLLAGTFFSAVVMIALLQWKSRLEDAEANAASAEALRLHLESEKKSDWRLNTLLDRPALAAFRTAWAGKLPIDFGQRVASAELFLKTMERNVPGTINPYLTFSEIAQLNVYRQMEWERRMDGDGPIA